MTSDIRAAGGTRPTRRLAAAGLAGILLAGSGCSPDTDGGAPSGQQNPAPSAPPPPIVASVDTVLANRPLFGVYLRDRAEKNLDRVTDAAGCRPTLLELFASVADGVSTTTIRAVPGVPVLSIEPWRPKGPEEQKDFTLKATIDGRWDEQYKKMARAVLEYRDVVLVRFAHEMNGHWYPWAATNGNKSGQYVAAWRHVVDLFRAEGVTNALWVWSPNILRGTGSKTIRQYWPGDKYVDSRTP